MAVVNISRCDNVCKYKTLLVCCSVKRIGELLCPFIFYELTTFRICCRFLNLLVFFLFKLFMREWFLPMLFPVEVELLPEPLFISLRLKDMIRDLGAHDLRHPLILCRKSALIDLCLQNDGHSFSRKLRNGEPRYGNQSLETIGMPCWFQSL